MVTVITLNDKEYVLKYENIATILKAMTRPQLDLLFTKFEHDVPKPYFSKIISNCSYIASISKAFEKLAQEGIVGYKKMLECSHCGKLIAINDGNKVETKRGTVYYCEECLETQTEICPTCNKRKLKTETILLVNEDKTIITCCYPGVAHAENIRSCSHCRKLYVSKRDFWGNLTDRLCPICKEEYEICDNCGRAVLKDDIKGGMCSACIKSRKVRDAIKSYGYKPDPVFICAKDEVAYPEYMGLEWEMELIADSTYKRRKVRAVEDSEWNNSERNKFFAYELNTLAEDWAYCKSDGSLDYCVEFVTHPITLKAWEKDYYSKLQAIKECMKAWGCRTKASTAGIHIHFSRSKLDDATIKRICWFLSQTDNYEFMRKFCHRNKDNMTHWAKRHSYWSSKLDNFYYDTDSRYRIVNLCNRNTIEFRCFGYTTDVDEIMIYLYAVDSIVNYCRDHKNKDVEKASMIEVLTYRNTEKMVQYLEGRSDLEECV